MTDQSKKVSQLTIATSAANTDRVVLLSNPSTNASLKTIALTNLSLPVNLSNSVPANSTSVGTAGSIRYDSSYIYVCTANNTWKRSALTTW